MLCVVNICLSYIELKITKITIKIKNRILFFNMAFTSKQQKRLGYYCNSSSFADAQFSCPNQNTVNVFNKFRHCHTDFHSNCYYVVKRENLVIIKKAVKMKISLRQPTFDNAITCFPVK